MKPVLIVGAGPAGLSAAAELASLGAPSLLVERESYLGGNPTKWRYSLLVPDLKPTEEVLGGLLRKVETEGRIERRLSTVITKAERSSRGYRVTLRSNGSEEVRDVSAVVLATGFEHFDSRRKLEYGYGRYPDVVDFKELEGMITDDRIVRPSDGKPPQRIAWVLCVGSRDIQVGNTYCCRMGCSVSIKQAVEVRKRHPEIEAFVYYMDIRTYGLWEHLYWDAMQEYGVKFVRGRVGHIAPAEGGTRLIAAGEDTLVNRRTEVPFDMIVLASGMEPGTGTTGAAKLFGVKVGPEGFLAPASSDLNPIDSGVPGVFYAGAATGPKAIVDSVTEGMGAALRAFQYARD